MTIRMHAVALASLMSLPAPQILALDKAKMGGSKELARTISADA